MRRFPALILAAALSLPVVVIAQQWTPPGADQDPAPESDSGDDSGSSVFERGMESFMQNMLKEAEPHLERLGRDLGDIGALMDDVKNYQAPERLENGDILIRRRADAPPPPPVGNALREMLRPAPEDDPSLPRSDVDPPRVPDRVLPETDPASEIEL